MRPTPAKQRHQNHMKWSQLVYIRMGLCRSCNGRFGRPQRTLPAPRTRERWRLRRARRQELGHEIFSTPGHGDGLGFFHAPRDGGDGGDGTSRRYTRAADGQSFERHHGSETWRGGRHGCDFLMNLGWS